LFYKDVSDTEFDGFTREEGEESDQENDEIEKNGEEGNETEELLSGIPKHLLSV
jgi:hypothetical protein